ncbi:TIGR01777 family oxidoreductase [Myxococcota bacterium]|nr:TIGR01777 family oxidoreductase [Myxococcota bacterium]
MDVLVTGATGFLGRKVCAALAARGDRVRVLSRSTGAGWSVPGAAEAFATPAHGEPFPAAGLQGGDAVVHLAGEPVAGGRWTEARKARILDSRVLGTRALVEGLRGAERPPAVLVSASAVGYYGDRGDETLTEESPPGQDFLAETCLAWEAEARAASDLGIRVVTLRIGVVLGREGGALPKMLPAYRLGLGGRLGSGRQWVPWIHADDVVGLVLLALDEPGAKGPIHAVAPGAVTQRELAASLARALGRPALAPPAPSWVLRLALGEMAGVLLGSQRAIPARAEALGYAFRYPRLDEALVEAVGGPRGRGGADA